MMLFCNKCGVGIDANSNFCTECGAPAKKAAGESGMQMTELKLGESSNRDGTEMELSPPALDEVQLASQEQPGGTANLSVDLLENQTAALGIATVTFDKCKRFTSDVVTKLQTAHPHKLKAVAVVGVTLLVLVLLLYSQALITPSSGWYTVVWWCTFLLTLVPLSCGSLFILISGAVTPSWFIKFSHWMDLRAANSRVSESRFNRFIARPALWSYEILDEKALRINDDMLRNGAKVATFTFSIILFSLLLYFAIAVVILVIVIAITIFIINAYEGNKGNSSRIFGALTGVSQRSEGTVHSGTNVFNEQVIGRVDEDGNVYQGSNFLNEQKVGRVDAEGNRYEGTNFFNENKTGRIDEDGNMYEGTNFFNENKTGRVDEDGNIFEGTNVFNERKVGRIEKK
jgi:hypothetical protein